MRELVIIPGGFHPFHSGHYDLYRQAQNKFPAADIYFAASDSTKQRPFPFTTKKRLAELSGIPSKNFVQTVSPYRPIEITRHYDPDNTKVIFIVSDKDGLPPGVGKPKRDGSPSYFQEFGHSNAPLSQHGYFVVLPALASQKSIAYSGAEIREKWPRLRAKQRTELIHDLYPATIKDPRLVGAVADIFDLLIGKPTVNTKTQTRIAKTESVTNPDYLDE